MPARIYGQFKTAKVSVTISQPNKLKLRLLAAMTGRSLSATVNDIITVAAHDTRIERAQAELVAHLTTGGTLDNFKEQQ